MIQGDSGAGLVSGSASEEIWASDWQGRFRGFIKRFLNEGMPAWGKPRRVPGMQDKPVLIPDLGIGNLPSIIRMAEKVGASCSVTRDPEELAGADKIIFAGVGAFDHGMAALNAGGWREALETAALERKVPSDRYLSRACRYSARRAKRDSFQGLAGSTPMSCAFDRTRQEDCGFRTWGGIR